MKILRVQPLRRPEVIEIKHTLDNLQKEVGGDIEAIYPWEDNAAIICNEEGKYLNLPLNRALKDQNGNIYDIVAGTFLIVGLGEENFISLTDKQIAHYRAMYSVPEFYVG